MELLEKYEEWDVNIPPFPSRSRLYRLEPIGIGTPYVESLTSYVARLARMHHVSPKELVKREILPLQGITDTDPNFYFRLNMFWTKDSHNINGNGLIAERWLKALQNLTSCDDLHFLTMYTWSEVIAIKRLLRPNKAWCPQCYEECMRSHQTIYDHLLWALNGVDVCPLHQQLLLIKCSTCQRPQPFLMQNTLVGYCSYCRNWLGGRSESLIREPVSSVADDFKKQIWIAEVVGKFLASAPDFSVKLPKERVATVLEICVHQYAGGNLSTLARLFGMTVQGLWVYLYKGGVPYFDSLLQICWALSMSPAEFFKLNTNQSLEPQKFILDHLPKAIRSRKKRAHLKMEDIQHIKLCLETILEKNADAHPHLKEIALHLGYSVTTLQSHFPELTTLLLTRQKSWPEDFFKKAKLELEEALISTEPVPLSKVLRSLGCDRDVLYRYFPDLCQAIVTRYQERFSYEQIRKRLEEAIVNDKATSVAEITRNLGYRSSYLHGLYPDLCKQIEIRRRTELKRQHECRMENTCNEIKQAVLTLHTQGIFPSRRRVRSMLSDPHMMRRNEGRETLRSILEALGYSTNVRKTD